MMLEAFSVQAAPLRSRVVDRLKTAIIVGELKAGEKLSERALCDALTVSRTSLREALRVLESEGVVQSIPNRGVFVATITPADVRDIYATRGALEGLMVREFVERASDAQVEDLRRAVVALKNLNQDFDFLSYIDLKTRFYEVLMEGSSNAVAAGALRAIHARIAQLWATSLRHDERAETSAVEIQFIVDAVRARDADEAYRRLMAHNVSAMKNTLEVLAASQAERPGE